MVTSHVDPDVELLLVGGGRHERHQVPADGRHELRLLAPHLGLRAPDRRQVDLVPESFDFTTG